MNDKSSFKAAMFDFDGTVTEKGEYTPPKVLADRLVGLSQKIPIGFCTGRQLESFQRHGLNELLREIDPDLRRAFLENLFLFAENGAIGYDFNTEKEVFEEFYRVEWPEEFIPKEVLKKQLKEAIKDLGDVYDNAHRVVIVMRTNLHDVITREVEEVYALSARIYEVTRNILENVSAGFEQYLHAGNSGIGVIIGPANGDKDQAIKRFGELLTTQRGVKFEPNFRDILVIGDSPQIGGNDHYFLQGTFGTAYTVGDHLEGKEFPIPVTDKSGERLFNAKGTLHLVESFFKF